MRIKKLLTLIKKNLLFVLMVGVPTFCAIIYYGVIASDVYVSESSFVVRSPDKSAATGLGLALKSIGFSSANQEIYAVHDFIKSRDALQSIGSSINFKALYGSNAIDRFSRFNGFGFDNSEEALFAYYLKQVEVKFDSVTSISTLKVKGFDPAVVHMLNERLMHIADEQLSKTNSSARSDMVTYSESEVKSAQERVRQANQKLSNFKKNKKVVDPVAQSQAALSQILSMQEKLFSTKSQYEQIKQIAPQNPQVAVLETRITQIEADIASVQQSISGDSDSFNNQESVYSNLILEKGFADTQLETALASFESAKNDFARKQLYLQSVVKPSLPDEALLPNRLRGVLTVFVLAFIFWLCYLMVITGIKEHTV